MIIELLQTKKHLQIQRKYFTRIISRDFVSPTRRGSRCVPEEKIKFDGKINGKSNNLLNYLN